MVFLDEGSDECAAYELKFGFGGHEYGVEIRVDETVDVGLVFLRLEVGGVPAPLDDEVDANPPADVCSESSLDGCDLYVREVTETLPHPFHSDVEVLVGFVRVVGDGYHEGVTQLGCNSCYELVPFVERVE